MGLSAKKKIRLLWKIVEPLRGKLKIFLIFYGSEKWQRKVAMQI
jgi:hypothetical protein